MYGLMLLLAIAACCALTGYRWVRWGGDWDLVFRVAVWGVAAGIVGARLYHDITSWNEVPDKWWGPFAVWQGGLGGWGGILFGVLVCASIRRTTSSGCASMRGCRSWCSWSPPRSSSGGSSSGRRGATSARARARSCPPGRRWPSPRAASAPGARLIHDDRA